MRGALTRDTPIKSRHAPTVRTVGDAEELLKQQTGTDRKMRCESPFRNSTSDNAFVRLEENGELFLHDNGSGVTYQIADDFAFPPLTAEEEAVLDAALGSDQADFASTNGSAGAGGAGGAGAGGGGAGGGGAGGGAGGGPAPAGQTVPPLRPTIVELPSNMAANARKALAALVDQGAVYRRSRSLVVPDASVVLDTRRGKKQHVAVVDLVPANLVSFLDGAAHFLKFNKDRKLVPAYPSTRLCNDLMAYVADHPTGLPALNGVARGPFLRRDGSVCTEPGYDAESGIFLHPGETIFPAMPELTPANAKKVAAQALERLLRPLRAYQFDTSVRDAKGAWDLRNDVSRAVAVSMFLTGVSVHATRTRPAYLADAPTFGSGKTLLIELPSLMMLGTDPPLISLADEHGREERDKALDAMLLRGTGCIVFDNAKGDLARFGKLIVLLSGTVVPVRLFHTQKLVDIDNNVLVTLSGNNTSTSEDMARRILRSRIDTGFERPDQVHYDFDPRDEVVRDRAQMIVDALTIPLAYQVAGSPAVDGRAYGSFEEWAKLVRDPLRWLGLPDIATSNDSAQADDPTRAALRAVIDAWEAAGLTGEYTCEGLIKLTESATPS